MIANSELKELKNHYFHFEKTFQKCQETLAEMTKKLSHYQEKSAHLAANLKDTSNLKQQHEKLNENHNILTENYNTIKKSFDDREPKYKENQKILQSTPAQNLILPSAINDENDRDSIYKNGKENWFTLNTTKSDYSNTDCRRHCFSSSSNDIRRQSTIVIPQNGLANSTMRNSNFDASDLGFSGLLTVHSRHSMFQRCLKHSFIYLVFTFFLKLTSISMIPER